MLARLACVVPRERRQIHVTNIVYGNSQEILCIEEVPSRNRLKSMKLWSEH